METISAKQALSRKLAPKRTRAYHYRPGAFTLTASFRDASIDERRVAMVAALAGTFTQHHVARILGCGVSTVSKCVRIIAARTNGTPEPEEQ